LLISIYEDNLEKNVQLAAIRVIRCFWCLHCVAVCWKLKIGL